MDSSASQRGRVLYCWAGDGGDPSTSFSDVAQLGRTPYDVAIVGAGVVGCALAYQLSQYQLRVLMLDKNFDVGEGTSKGNSAIIHTGFDAPEGTLEAELVTQASRVWPELAAKLKVPLRPNGGLLLALDDEQARQLDSLRGKALKNAVDDVDLVSTEDIKRLEPHASPTARGGLLVPRESIIDPFSVSIAYAELAAVNGVDVVFGINIVGVEDAATTIKKIVDQNGHRFPARIIVNVAGLGSRQVAETYRGRRFDINPRRGQFLLYDKNIGDWVSRILLPVPTAKTKGKLVTPTIFGNLLAGPTAEDLELGHRDATSTTIDGLIEVREAAHRMCPALRDHQPIASYAGARCNCAQGSYQVIVGDGHPGMITVTGVRSTGLTASPTLAEYLIEKMCDAGWLSLVRDPEASESRSEDCWPGWWRPPYDEPGRVAAEPSFGRMVCFCETISEGEIVHALDSPLRPRTFDAVKRRTRAQMGRCQGFNCHVKIAEIVGHHCGVPLESVTKSGPGTELLPVSLVKSS